MKKIMDASPRSLFALAVLSVCVVGVARAQGRDFRVISARAGAVNFVSGDVRVRRSGGSEWRNLAADDELSNMDAVRTGADGRVEILLNPGSYLRVGTGAEFTLADTSLDDLRIALARGSVVVEATGYSDLDLSITLATPRTRLRIVRSGVYRINVLPTGAAEVAVLKGRAFIGADETLVKGGRVARARVDGVEVSKLDKNERDALDLWSRERGKELAKANERLSSRSVQTMLARASFDDLFPSSSRFGFGGLWLWNSRGSCYTFLPFYAGWESPYGYGYGTGARIFYGSSPGQPSPGYTPPSISRDGSPYNPPTWPTPGTSPGGTVSGGTLPTRPPSSDPSPIATPIRETPQPAPHIDRSPVEGGRTPRDRP